MKSDLAQALALTAYCTMPESGTTESGIQKIHCPELLQELLNYKPKNMQEDNKYFTPTIEDLHVGYECEVLPINKSLGWEAGKLSYYSGYEGPGLYNLYPFWYTTRKSNYGRIKTMIHDFKQIRVPYLTKEQIEKEGWIYRPDTFLIENLKKQPTHFWFTKNGYGLTFYPNQDNLIDITDDREDTTFPVTLFRANCPSINEFRTIMKLLNIK